MTGIAILAGCCLLGRIQKQRTGRAAHMWFLPVFFLLGAVLWERADQETELEAYFLRTGSFRGCVEGYVASVQTGEEGVEQITVESAAVQTEDGRWVKGKGIVIYLDKGDIQVKIGNRIRAEGELSPFEEASNPGQFDMKSYRRAQGMDGRMWGESAAVLDGETNGLRQSVWEFRETVKKTLNALAEPEDAGVFCAVFLGDKSGLSEEVKELYETSGIAHIYAVSGTHVSILGALFYQFVRRGTGSYGIAAGVGSVFLMLYAVLVGGPVSAVRAVVMFICHMAANHLGRMYDLVSALSLAAVVILCWQPLQVTQCGFQLSFAAVLGIGIVGPAILPRGKKRGRMAETIAMALGVQLAMVPIQLYHFFDYPIYSFFLNLCVLPAAPLLIFSILGGACAGLLLPGSAFLGKFFIGRFFLGRFFLGGGHLVLSYYKYMCQLSLKLPGAVYTAGRPRTIQLAVYYLLLIGFVVLREYEWQKKKADMEWRREKTGRVWNREEAAICLVGLACLGLGLAGLRRISWDEWMGRMSVTMLDVGQGDGFVIRLPDGAAIMVDGGSTSESQVGMYCLEPYLKYEGISSLDYVFLSHGDADHVNGVQEIMERESIHVNVCVLPDEKLAQEHFSSILQAAEATGTSIQYLTAGMQIQRGDVGITCLHPEEGAAAEEINETSQVLLLEMGAFRMLFTGDIGKGEAMLLERLSGSPVTVLKVAHHGSKYSTGETFLERVRPSYAWISCGENNRYGHPHEETVERLKESGCVIYTTPECGAVRVVTDGEKVSIGHPVP